eukprot:6284108-Pyramimonas_sp.AAC.1
MSRRPTSRDATARERQAVRRQPRASTDPAPLCRIGSSMVSGPQRSGPLCDRWAEVGSLTCWPDETKTVIHAPLSYRDHSRRLRHDQRCRMSAPEVGACDAN